jgi:hypothetical protein
VYVCRLRLKPPTLMMWILLTDTFDTSTNPTTTQADSRPPTARASRNMRASSLALVLALCALLLLLGSAAGFVVPVASRLSSSRRRCARRRILINPRNPPNLNTHLHTTQHTAPPGDEEQDGCPDRCSSRHTRWRPWGPRCVVRVQSQQQGPQTRAHPPCDGAIPRSTHDSTHTNDGTTQVYLAADLGKIVSDEIYGPMFFQVRVPSHPLHAPTHPSIYPYTTRTRPSLTHSLAHHDRIESNRIESNRIPPHACQPSTPIARQPHDRSTPSPPPPMCVCTHTGPPPERVRLPSGRRARRRHHLQGRRAHHRGACGVRKGNWGGFPLEMNACCLDPLAFNTDGRGRMGTHTHTHTHG